MAEPGGRAVREAGIRAGSATARAILGRANIFEMTQAAEDAVLSPLDHGGLPHDLRAALAARMARLNGEEGVARGFETRIGDAEFAALADPAHGGAGTPHAGLLAFVDKVAARPKDIEADDIEALKGAGFADADIVRLCELIAFLAYELRVIAGLRLLDGSAS